MSNVMPLPTRVIFGALSGPQTHIDQARLARTAAADRVDHREVLRQQFVASDDGDRCAVTFGEHACSVFDVGRSHVGRRRIDEIAAEPNGLGGVDDPRRARRFQPQLGAACT